MIDEYFVNPFTVIQQGDSGPFIYITNSPDSLIQVSEPDHPLFGVTRVSEFKMKLNLLTEEDKKSLFNLGFISGKPFDRGAMLAAAYDDIESMEKWSIILMPTMNCNNSCRYCYQDHIGQPVMNEDDYLTIRKYIKRKIKNGLKDVSISLMGGEPTLVSQDLIRFLNGIKQMCSEEKVGFTASLTTNGRLLGSNSLAKLFTDAGVRSFQITLDGTFEVHDRSRCGLNGETTFQETLAGLLAVKALERNDIRCTIRANHTKDSLTGNIIDDYLNLLADSFAGDCRFEIFHNLAADLGGGIDTTNLLSHQEAADKLFRMNEQTISKGLLVKTDFFQPNGRVCYAARKNSIGIMPGGQLIKCTTATEPFNYVGYLDDNGNACLNQYFDMWVNPDALNGNKCSKCAGAPICQGRSCPLERIRTGKNPCPDAKNSRYLSLQIGNQSLLNACSTV